MAIQQTRIFVPSNDPLDGWAETVLGTVIRVVSEEFQDHLRWFWFSRYISTIDDGADCDIGQIPAHFKQAFLQGQPPMHRSIRFRFEIDNAQEIAFRTRITDVVNQNGYAISGVIPYDKVGDTGNNRFLGVENRGAGRNAQRADAVTHLYAAIGRLVLDALTGPDANGRYHIETSDDLVQNPRGSTFQSVHHLFCNISNVPLDVVVCERGGQYFVGTAIHPPGPWHFFQRIAAHPVRF